VRACPPLALSLIAALAAGCNGRPLNVEARATGTTDGGGDAAPADVIEAVGGVCSSPDICSDDPAMSAVAGMCVPDGDSWYCQCADGFSINPKTNRCRVGSTCVAAAADAWDFKVAFDASSCASRAPTACDAPQHQGDVEAELLALPGQSCTLPEALTVRIEVVGGCPTVLEGSGPHPSGGTLNSYYLDYLHCLAASIQGVRLACGGATDCVMAEWDTLAP
jgi:hypothetical protein